MADLTLATSGRETIPDLRPVLRAHRVMLALDLGTTTGWALHGIDGLITSGTASFRPGRFDGGGMRYLRFTNWLTEIDRLSGPIAAIWFEEVRRRTGSNPCFGSDGSSRRSRRDTAGRSRTAPPARHSSAGGHRRRWCCRRTAAGDRQGSRDRPPAMRDCAGARGWSPAARSPRRHRLHRPPRARRPAACPARHRKNRPETGRSRRPAGRS